MPINTTHPTYDTKCSEFTVDAYNGNVKHYVERLQMQSRSDYEAYVNRACYYNVTKRTTDALIGAMLRKPHTTSLDNINVSDGMTFETFMAYILRDIFLTSRVGILVDFDEDKQQPYMVPYDNAAIINWGDDFVILREVYYKVDPDDKYKKEIKEQFRELTLIDGVYHVRIWRQGVLLSSTQETLWEIAEQHIPTNRGVPLNYIPFVFVNDKDTTDECRKPTMLNLAQVNVSHFRTIADIEQCAHFLALPQPYISGDFQDSNMTNVSLGGSQLWRLEEGSSVGYLEYNGAGINSLQAIADRKEAQMANLGSRLITKSGVESAEALRLRTVGESSTLVSMINALEQGLKIAVGMYGAWMGMEPSTIEFDMNRDFDNVLASSQDVATWIQLLTGGHISQETFLQRLYQGEIIDDIDKEKDRLVNQD